MNEPTEWLNYDQSSLPKLLRHDTWGRHYGLSLLCGIDPKKSEAFNPLQYYKIPYDEIGTFADETGTDISDTQYWTIQLLADPPNSARRTWYENFDDYEAAIYDWDSTRKEFPEMANEKSLDELLKDRHVAQRVLDDTNDIFSSNPDHDSTFVAHPNYFIDWAKAKNIDIRWLEWAETRKWISTPSEQTTNLPKKPDKRAKDSRLAFIGALLASKNIDPNSANMKELIGLTEDFGAPLSRNTISAILNAISSAAVEVQDRKRVNK